jgi:hypothetical protein
LESVRIGQLTCWQRPACDRPAAPLQPQPSRPASSPVQGPVGADTFTGRCLPVFTNSRAAGCRA